ncbi:MAG: HAMP domain-containing sensor histidine kinase [Lachnospiraceae bacterium]|nr:HAMP domain-containing sensor histidine kinase [Lachnospiraceae bacterium]
MNFFSKIFITVTLILCTSLSLSGYLLTSLSFQNAFKQETEQALEQYQVTKFTFESKLISLDAEKAAKTLSDELLQNSFSPLSQDHLIAVFSKDKKAIYSEYPAKYKTALFSKADFGQLVYQVETLNNSHFLTVAGCFSLKNQTFYLLYSKNINAVFTQKKTMARSFQFIYCVVCTLSILILLIFSTLFVYPLKKMTKFARKITQGDYSSRVAVHTHDELGELAETCNTMADAISKSMNQLTQSAVQKEDFVANFAHELKTPLTSVIGYADMIYQKDLSKEETKNAARYILEEGLRLEELSRKLMDLIVLNRQDFELEELSAEEFLENISETLFPVCQSKQIRFHTKAQEAYLSIEFDLCKTLFLNLIDNAIKAGASSIQLLGEKMENTYQITVSDNGCGIPEEEISRITEAFYMVDKSRSRKQHGAGIGLALSARIAEIHKAALHFESKPGIGTRVIVIFPMKGDSQS